MTVAYGAAMQIDCPACEAPVGAVCTFHGNRRTIPCVARSLAGPPIPSIGDEVPDHTEPLHPPEMRTT